MTATTTSSQLLGIVAVGWIVIWLIPAVFVATYAARQGFDFGAMLVCALVLPWPLVLLVAAITGRRSPLARSRSTPEDWERRVEALEIEHARRLVR